MKKLLLLCLVLVAGSVTSVVKAEDVYIVGGIAGGDWDKSEGNKMTEADGVYTKVIEVSGSADVNFKVRTTSVNWIGYGDLTLDAPSGWIVDDGTNDHNFLLKKSTISSYTRFYFTAWNDNGWHLRVEGVDNTTSYTVSFVNMDSWEHVAAYTYDSRNRKALGGWPGTACTKSGTTTVDGNTYDVYNVEFNSYFEPTVIIFNNNDNGGQTPDLTFEDNKTYAKNKYTVNFVDEYNWKTEYALAVQAYAYNSINSATFGSWPGMSMGEPLSKLKIDGKNVFSLTNTAYESSYIIFNNKSGDDGNETSKLTFVNGKTYYVTYSDGWIEKAPANVTVTLNANGMATLNLPYKLDFSSDITNLEGAYWVKSITTDQLTATKIDAIAPANTGMILKGDANAVVTIPVSTSDATAIDGNKLHATTVPATIAADYAFILKGASFVPASAGTIPVFKAYLLASDIPDGEARELSMMFEDETTGINTMKTIVRSNEVRYNLAGQRVSDNYKGIVISNGKKVIVK